MPKLEPEIACYSETITLIINHSLISVTTENIFCHQNYLHNKQSHIKKLNAPTTVTGLESLTDPLQIQRGEQIMSILEPNIQSNLKILGVK